MSDRTVHRHRVPVDGQPHTVTFAGELLHIEAAGNGHVDLWTLHAPREFPHAHLVQVFGTGQSLPDDARYVGTTGRTPAGLIWHVFEIAATTTPERPVLRGIHDRQQLPSH
jgi:hypothetical protein